MKHIDQEVRSDTPRPISNGVNIPQNIHMGGIPVVQRKALTTGQVGGNVHRNV